MGERTNPEDADGVGRAVRRTIRFDHAEHPVKLPARKEDDEQLANRTKPGLRQLEKKEESRRERKTHVVRVPELFEPAVGSPSVAFEREPDHRPEAERHDPARHSWTGGEVGEEESFHSPALTASRRKPSVSVGSAGKGDSVKWETDVLVAIPSLAKLNMSRASWGKRERWIVRGRDE